MCELYPIALHQDTLDGAKIDQELEDIYNGTGPGNFGWLSWTGDPSVPTLAHSLTPPGDSETYVNPNDPDDHVLSAGDWVHGAPGVKNARSVRDALDALVGYQATVPVWDTADSGQGRGQGGGRCRGGRGCGGGNNLTYHVVGFARVQITGYQLGRHENRISAIYLGMASCGE